MSTARCSPTVWTVVNAMYAVNEAVAFFYDNQTGDIVCLEDPFDSDEPDEALEIHIESNPERFALLPGYDVVNEPARYRRFVATLDKTEEFYEELKQAAQSLHAGTLFVEAVEKAGQRAAWEEFREAEYTQLARDWLHEAGFILE